MTPNEDVVEDSPSKLKLGERKSISDTFSRFTTNTFSRRRTTTNVPASTSSNASNFRSRLPTPSGIPRGSSLFGGLNAIIPRSSPHKENQRRPHRSNYTRLRSPDPEEDSSDFFIKTPTNPLASASADEPDEQNHNTVITRRALMAPLSPPQPRTSTGGPRPHSGLMTGSEAPSFMHSTSSSAARSTGRAAMRSSLPSGTNDPSVQPRRRYRPIIIAGEEIPRRSPLMQKLRTNFSRPLTRSKNSAVVDEASGMVEPVEVDADSSIRVNETDMGEIETGMADSFFRSPSQIQGEAESSTLAAELAKELDTAQGDQVEVEKEPSVKERSQSPPEADQIHEPEHTIWWLGRLTSLSDRIRTEAVDRSLKTSSVIPGARLAFMHDDEYRTRQILIYLRKLCANDEVVESFEEFAKFWAKRAGLGGIDVKKKKTLLEMVMGKKKKKRESSR